MEQSLERRMWPGLILRIWEEMMKCCNWETRHLMELRVKRNMPEKSWRMKSSWEWKKAHGSSSNRWLKSHIQRHRSKSILVMEGESHTVYWNT